MQGARHGCPWVPFSVTPIKGGRKILKIAMCNLKTQIHGHIQIFFPGYKQRLIFLFLFFSLFRCTKQLDREKLDRYTIKVVAEDNGSPKKLSSTATVLLNVDDVNDNPPVFDRPTYETQITEEDDRMLPKRVLQVLEKSRKKKH